MATRFDSYCVIIKPTKFVNLCCATCLALHVFVGLMIIQSGSQNVAIYGNTNIIFIQI